MTKDSSMTAQGAPTVLITQATLFSLAGSETLTYELAAMLSGQGFSVVVGTFGASDTWSREFAALRNVRLLLIDDPLLESTLDDAPPAYAWIHHQIVPECLLRNPRTTRFIFNHMSQAHPLEFPYSPFIESSLASAVAFNSEETNEAPTRTGLLDGVDPERKVVLGNPAPDEYFIKRSSKPRRPRKLVVVSNHIPEEVLAAVDILGDEFSVEFIGSEADKGASPRRVTPEIVDAAAAVMTIGKTVQYCIAAGVPVYNYDSFGGAGWLSPSNFALARLHNFSGRGFSWKKPDEIARELRDGYRAACDAALTLQEEHAEEFRWTAAWERVRAIADSAPQTTRELDPIRIAAHTYAQRAIGTSLSVAADHVARWERLERTTSTPPQSAAAEALCEDHSNAAGHTAKDTRNPVPLQARKGAQAANAAARRVRVLGSSLRTGQTRGLLNELFRMRIRSASVFYRHDTLARGEAHTPRIVALLHVRDDQLTVRDCLDHLASIVDAVVVFDDSSTDDTARLIRNHPIVTDVIRPRRRGRQARGWKRVAQQRALLRRAKQLGPEWILAANVEERIEGDVRRYLLDHASGSVAGVAIGRFYAYLTRDDSEPYAGDRPLHGFRTMFGPERQDLVMVWRNVEHVDYRGLDVEQPRGLSGDVERKFVSQHYEKALSAALWDARCHELARQHVGQRDKLMAQVGEGIRQVSDSGRPLMTWREAQRASVPV